MGALPIVRFYPPDRQLPSGPVVHRSGLERPVWSRVAVEIG
jgi:hypothetical protein